MSSESIVWQQTGTPIPRPRTPFSPAPGYYIDSAGACQAIEPQTEVNKPD